MYDFRAGLIPDKRKEVYHVIYYILLTRLIELLIVMFI